MRITLDLTKSLEENAQEFFEAAKKARKKARGAEKVIAEWEQRKEETVQERPRVQRRRKKEWFERFRWCRSSEGFLLVGGRDASTNEALVKRHAEKGDLVFHTDLAGSPFVIVKAAQRPVPPQTIEEAAQFCAVFSRAWKQGLASLEVFHVQPEQVTKEAAAGEYLGKGSFVIRGRTVYHRATLALAIGLDTEGRVMSGPPRAVRTHCARSVEVVQGNRKTSDVAKELQQRIGGDLDELIAALPPGGCALKQ